MKKNRILVHDKTGDIVYDSKVVGDQIEKLGQYVTVIKPKRRSGAGRPKGSRNKLTDKKYNYIRDKYYFLKQKGKAHKLDEFARLIRSELKTSIPSWWVKKIYSLKTIKDIISRRKWGD